MEADDHDGIDNGEEAKASSPELAQQERLEGTSSAASVDEGGVDEEGTDVSELPEDDFDEEEEEEEENFDQEEEDEPELPARPLLLAGESSGHAGEGEGEGESEEPKSEEGEAPEPPSRRSHVAPAVISIDRIDDDPTFQMRPEGDLSALATDLARLGQLFPVDLRLKPPDRFQVISGFRRVAALRFLQRDKVVARLHTSLSDDDALLMSLAAAIHSTPASREELATLTERLESEGRLTAMARDMLEKAQAESDALASETVDEEVDADELAADVTERLGNINQDLSLLADAFASLDEVRKAELLKQLQYSADLIAFLEGR